MGSRLQGSLKKEVGGFVGESRSSISTDNAWKRIDCDDPHPRQENKGEDNVSEKSSYRDAILALAESGGNLPEAEMPRFQLKEGTSHHPLPLPLALPSACGCQASVLANPNLGVVGAVPSSKTCCGHQQRKKRVMEKTSERRQKRMINNRESAARSRARRQAYTSELEIEVAHLIEENAKLKVQGVSASLIPAHHSQQMKNILRRTRTAPF